MGCDIHFYVETLSDQGIWVTADTWEYDGYDEDPNARYVDYKKAFYSARCYDLFSILANVRNGYGFAGVDTGDGFVPIADPRGVPDDASAEYKDACDRYGCDGHSHSYLTVAEILDYDWTQTTKKRGVVDLAEWARWRDYGKPESWAGSVEGGNVRNVSPDDIEAAWQLLRSERGYPEQRYAFAHLRENSDPQDLARLTQLLGGGSIYCQVEWAEPYYARAKSFWSETMPRLCALGKPDCVRCCFFFDN